MYPQQMYPRIVMKLKTNTHKMSSTNSSHTQTEPSSDTTPSHHDDVHSENDFQSQSTAWMMRMEA